MELRRRSVGGGEGGVEEVAGSLGCCWGCCVGDRFREGVFGSGEGSGLDPIVAVKDAVEERVGFLADCAGAGDGGGIGVRWEEGRGLRRHGDVGGLECRLVLLATGG